MADQLHLSYWLKGFTALNMHRHLEAVLARFPFSRLRPGALLRVQAVDPAEPPLAEQTFQGIVDVAAVAAACRDFQGADCCYQLEAAWDLWQLAPDSAGHLDWRLLPSEVTLACYGPLFPSQHEEQLRVTLGPETRFLPQAGLSANLAPVRQNIRSLLHLVQDLDEALAAGRRRLWSDSGGDFSERLRLSLAGGPV